MVSMDIQEPVKRKQNANLAIHLPAAFWAHMEYQDADELVVQCAVGKHGPFVYLVNPRQQRRWVRELKAKELEEKVAAEKVVYFTTASWKGVKDVFRCARCGTYRDTRDAMIEHVLLHYPANQQEDILEKLMKEN